MSKISKNITSKMGSEVWSNKDLPGKKIISLYIYSVYLHFNRVAGNGAEYCMMVIVGFVDKHDNALFKSSGAQS